MTTTDLSALGLLSAADLYTRYTTRAQAAGVTPKSFKSFPSKKMILAAYEALPAPKPVVKSAPARSTSSTPLTKVQRAKLRAYATKHNVKRESGAAWDVETMSNEMRAVIGLPKKGG